MPLEQLTRARIVEALNLLGELAEQEQVTLELCVFGGGAMMLAYGTRRTTKDVDAIMRPSDIARQLAKLVAERLSLSENWLNDDLKQFVSAAGTFASLEIEELESAARKHLKITRASAAYLLAMKCLACRIGVPGQFGDLDDIRFLIKKMDIRTVEQIELLIERFYPHDTLMDQARTAIEDLLPKKEDASS
jgi:hypothetical protein